jgi:hypothetical protein
MSISHILGPIFTKTALKFYGLTLWALEDAGASDTSPSHLCLGINRLTAGGIPVVTESMGAPAMEVDRLRPKPWPGFTCNGLKTTQL